MTNATGYLIDLQDVTADTPITTNPVNGGATTSDTLGGLSAGDTYEWYMYAYDGLSVSWASTPYYFTVQSNGPAPAVTAVGPTVGSTAGGSTVTITGTNLTGATAVDFGGTAATITSDTATQITATSPAGVAGTVDVTVTTPAGTSAKSSADQFTYGAVLTVSTSAAANAHYKAGSSVPITLTFDTAVQVSGTPQLTLNDGGLATYASGSGTAKLTFTYLVAAGQNTADLDYASTTALVVPNGGGIEDLAGNVLPLTLPPTGTDGLAAKNIVIDTTAPTVTTVSSTKAAGTYGVGTAIPITVTFSERVTVTGTPKLTLNAGSGAVATYTSVSGDSLTFTYTVAAKQSTADLDYASTAALALNGGSIKDLAGNVPTLTLPATGTDGLWAEKIVINTTPPTVKTVSSTKAAGTYAVGTVIPITVTFSKPVAVTGTPKLTLNAGKGAAATYTSGSGTATLLFTYTVAAKQNTTDLDYASTAARARSTAGASRT